MYEYKAKVLRVVDGDTFDAEVDLGFTVSVNVRFRIANFDAPESWRPKTLEEKIHGEAATEFAKKLLEGKEIRIRSFKEGRDISTGSFGRWLAVVILPDEHDYSDVMIMEGFSKRSSYSDET